MNTVIKIATFAISLISTMVSASEYKLDFNKSDPALIESVAQLYNYPAENISIAKYDLEDNGSLELFVQFDSTCDGSMCFRAVLINSNGSYTEIFRGTHPEMNIIEGQAGSISSIQTGKNTVWDWYSLLAQFVPSYVGDTFIEFDKFTTQNKDEAVVQYYANLHSSRNIKVFDFDFLADGKQERLVVDSDIQNCRQWKYCRGYLYNSSSDTEIMSFTVGQNQIFKLIDDSTFSKFVVQSDNGYSIFAYTGDTLEKVDSVY